MTRSQLGSKTEVSLASWVDHTSRSALQDMLDIAAQPEITSFALGLPAAELFPITPYTEAVKHVLATNPSALQYAPPSSVLKNHIVNMMKERGVHCRKEQIFLTTGAQQGQNLLAHLLLDPGGQIIVEEAIYSGFKQVLDVFQPQLFTVTTDMETGIDVDAVERLLTRGTRPAFIYVVANGHNPLSMSISPEKRLQLVTLARQYRVPIVEDDPYGALYYEEKPPLPLRALDEQWVFYVGTFSKILAPSLRVGWVIVPEDLIPMLAILKEASDINTTTFAQHTIAAYLDTGHQTEHIKLLRAEYKKRRDTMLAALSDYLPDAHWTQPNCGLFIWLTLPRHVDTMALLKIAIEQEHVAFVPGQAFTICEEARYLNCLRLNFSNNPPDKIRTGIASLAQALAKLV